MLHEIGLALEKCRANHVNVFLWIAVLQTFRFLSLSNNLFNMLIVIVSRSMVVLVCLVRNKRTNRLTKTETTG